MTKEEIIEKINNGENEIAELKYAVLEILTVIQELEKKFKMELMTEGTYLGIKFEGDL